MRRTSFVSIWGRKKKQWLPPIFSVFKWSIFNSLILHSILREWKTHLVTIWAATEVNTEVKGLCPPFPSPTPPPPSRPSFLLPSFSCLSPVPSLSSSTPSVFHIFLVSFNTKAMQKHLLKEHLIDVIICWPFCFTYFTYIFNFLHLV